MEKTEFELDSIDFRIYLKIVQKWKWLIIGITALAVATSGILSFFVLSPVYESKTVVMVKQYQDPKAVQDSKDREYLESVVNALSRLPQMTIKTYVGQMENEALLRNVIDALKLDGNVYTPKFLSGIIDVKVIPETNLIEVSVKNNDPGLAAKIANTLAEKFLVFVGTANEKQLVLSAEFLSKQLAEKDKDLAEAVKNLNQYRNQERNTAYLEKEVEGKNQNLFSFRDQLLKVETDLKQAGAGKAAVEEKIKNIPEKIKVLKYDQQLGKTVETEEINPAYTEISGMIAQMSVELAELDAREESIRGIVDSLQAEVKSLQAELNTKREEDSRLAEKADQIKKIRDVLAEKLTQVQVIKSMNLSQTSLQIVTPAFPPDSPVSPRKMLNMSIAVVLGLMVSVGGTFILEFLNNTINKAEDIEQHLRLPILGAIPFARKEDFS